MKIAITGTIGSGKSTVASYLREKGYHVFDCDKTNEQILNSDYLIPYFPSCFNDNKLDKKALADIVFNDNKAKELLQSLSHPYIYNKMQEESNLYNPFFAEVPLLYEVGWDAFFDKVLLVVTNEDIAIDRLTKKGYSIKESKQRIKNQMSVKDKIARSDVIIYNDSSLFSLHEKVDEWLDKNAW